MWSRPETIMGNVSGLLFGTYYLKTIHRDAEVLHYRRTPTWRSLVLFTGEQIRTAAGEFFFLDALST